MEVIRSALDSRGTVSKQDWLCAEVDHKTNFLQLGLSPELRHTSDHYQGDKESRARRHTTAPNAAPADRTGSPFKHSSQSFQLTVIRVVLLSISMVLAEEEGCASGMACFLLRRVCSQHLQRQWISPDCCEAILRHLCRWTQRRSRERLRPEITSGVDIFIPVLDTAQQCVHILLR
eukprot:5179206-Amphidinium_carterae.1